jgi:hypothetical protein
MNYDNGAGLNIDINARVDIIKAILKDTKEGFYHREDYKSVEFCNHLSDLVDLLKKPAYNQTNKCH